MRGKKQWRRTVWAGLVVLGGAAAAWAAAGDLDTSYGTGGVALEDVALGSSCSWAVQSGGRVVLAGTEDGATTWKLARFTAGGYADAAFESAVQTQGPVAGVLRSIALDGDDILACGDRNVTTTSGKGKGGTQTVRERVVARWLDDGTPDTDFGTGGVFVFPEAEFWDVAALAALPDGRVLVGGTVLVKEGKGKTASPYHAWKLARLNANGSVDTSFGTLGYLLYNPTPLNDYVQSMLVLPDGSYLVSGREGHNDFHPPTTPGNWVVARFSASGALVARVSRATTYGPSLSLDPDGLVLAAGMTWGDYNDPNKPPIWPQMVVARYDVSGGGIALDGSFGSGGESVIGLPVSGVNYGPPSVSVDASHRVVLGFSMPPPGTPSEMDIRVCRLTAGGSLDTGFGASGFAGPLDIAPWVAGSAGLDDAGRILVAGVAGTPSVTQDWFAARLLAN